jgi:hypothetical protein
LRYKLTSISCKAEHRAIRIPTENFDTSSYGFARTWTRRIREIASDAAGVTRMRIQDIEVSQGQISLTYTYEAK